MSLPTNFFEHEKPNLGDASDLINIYLKVDGYSENLRPAVKNYLIDRGEILDFIFLMAYINAYLEVDGYDYPIRSTTMTPTTTRNPTTTPVPLKIITTP